MRALKSVAKRVLNLGPLLKCRREFKKQVFRRFNERPVEFAFLFRVIGEIYPRSILDVGTGESALPQLLRSCGSLVTAIDNGGAYWRAGMQNRHYFILNDDITHPRMVGMFDLVACISVLEHIEDADSAVANMFRFLSPGGHLVMTFPYTERSYEKNVYELPGSSYGQGASYICQSYSRQQLNKWLKQNDAKIIEQEYWQYWDGPFWTVGNQLIPPRKGTADSPHQLTCLRLAKDGCHPK